MATFADRLVELREKTGKKRQEVANDIGISRASLEYYEKNKRKPDIDVLLLLANYYGVTCDYLLKGVTTENVNINREIGLSNDSIENLKLLTQEKNAYCRTSSNRIFKIDIIDFWLSKLFAHEPFKALENLEIIASLDCEGSNNINDSDIEEAYSFLYENEDFDSKQLHIINNSTFRNFLISDTLSIINLFINQFSALYAPTDIEKELNAYGLSGLNQEKVIEYNKTKLIDSILSMSLYTSEDGAENGNDN
jgi:transcriptional regulator with XRE-family HTH domain